MGRNRLQCALKCVRNTLIVVIIIFLYFICKIRKSHRSEVATQIPKNALKYIFFEKIQRTSLSKNTSQLRSMASRYNEEGKILNGDLYGPIEKDTIVLVITVHKISIYFEFLLVSLSQVRGIEQALIIFSHPYFDEEVNHLIRSIDFCRVLQIYFPYSTQMYPDEFPGPSPGDCPVNMDMKDAETRNCTGSGSPDYNGRFRNPKQAEQKHHWWWTANEVFEKVLSPYDHRGMVVFLKDDLYILQDFLYMIMYMKRIGDFLTNCDFFTLECLPFSYSCIKNTQGLEVTNFDPKFELSVLAFDINAWNNIVSYYDLFCVVDDYSWARSIYYISMIRKDSLRYRIMTSMFPRAFKTSSCGLNDILVDCDAIESVYQILDVQKKYEVSLYPAFLEVYTHIDNEDDDMFGFDYSESNGGWSDPRDRELCQNLTKSKIKKVVMTMREELIKFVT